jgi:hypothetical protein
MGEQLSNAQITGNASVQGSCRRLTVRAHQQGLLRGDISFEGSLLSWFLSREISLDTVLVEVNLCARPAVPTDQYDVMVQCTARFSD